MNATKPRSPKRPTRTVRVVEAPDQNAPDVWTVRITEAGVGTRYDVVRGLAAGRYAVWLWWKVLTPASVAQAPYVVDVANEFGASCTCKDCKQWGHCRHLEATRALTAAGKLPGLEPACDVCHGTGGPRAGDADSDGAACRSCGA